MLRLAQAEKIKTALQALQSAKEASERELKQQLIRLELSYEAKLAQKAPQFALALRSSYECRRTRKCERPTLEWTSFEQRWPPSCKRFLSVNKDHSEAMVSLAQLADQQEVVRKEREAEKQWKREQRKEEADQQREKELREAEREKEREREQREQREREEERKRERDDLDQKEHERMVRCLCSSSVVSDELQEREKCEKARRVTETSEKQKAKVVHLFPSRVGCCD